MCFIYTAVFSSPYNPKKDTCIEIEELSEKEKIYRCEAVSFGWIDLILSPGFTTIFHVTLARSHAPFNFNFLTYN